MSQTPLAGFSIVDKPSAWTSHDVVARIRTLAGTRRVGHAGTLDPMATGVLVVGVGAATRVLHHLTGVDKAYTATIRLGASTDTDDAEGNVIAGADAGRIDEGQVRAAMTALTGDIDQVPSAVSAIKVDGRRAYARVRAGETVELAPRRVRVTRFEATWFDRLNAGLLDVTVEVECSSGTYVRALARDLGLALRTGGHVRSLRRTRVGPFGIDRALTLEELAAAATPLTLTLPQGVRIAFGVRDIDSDEVRELSYGRSLQPVGIDGVHGAFAPDGQVIAMLHEQDGRARPVLVFAPAG